MRKTVVEREYVSVDALRKALDGMMKRNNIQSWTQTAFDASDIDDLIDGQREEDYITVYVEIVDPAADDESETENDA